MSISEKKKGVSRRGFLKGSALAAGGGILAGCSPKVASTAELSETKEEEQSQDMVIDTSQIKETVKADVVVVGAGMAGCCAALAAQEAGASVIVLQKADAVLTNGSGIAAHGSQIQKDNDIDFDIDVAVNEWMREVANVPDRKVVNVWVDHSGETVDWLADITKDSEVGSPFAPPNAGVEYPDLWTKSYPTAHLWAGHAMLGVATAVLEKAVSLGTTVYYQTPGVQLVQDEAGRITGVIGQTEAEEYIQFDAARGVILACGDYGNNPELRKQFFPHAEGIKHNYPQPVNTGDGHLMGVKAGGVIDNGPHAGIIHYTPFAGSGIPWLFVNALGQRFCNEDVSYDMIYAQDIKQPGYFHYQVFDDNYAADFDHMGNGMGRTEPPFAIADDMKTSVEDGTALMADSIEELAEKMGVPAENLVATVDRYNELVKDGHDVDFGKQAARLAAIEKGPFYAVKRVPYVLGILGGLGINEKMQVLDVDRQPISGLYAAGNNSGSFFGGLVHPMLIPGMSLGRASVTGRMAGIYAAEV